MAKIANIISKKDVELITETTIEVLKIKGSDMEAMVQRQRIRDIYIAAYNGCNLVIRSGKAGVDLKELCSQLRSRVNITLNFRKTTDLTRVKFTKRLTTITNYLAYSGRLS